MKRKSNGLLHGNRGRLQNGSDLRGKYSAPCGDKTLGLQTNTTWTSCQLAQEVAGSGQAHSLGIYLCGVCKNIIQQRAGVVAGKLTGQLEMLTEFHKGLRTLLGSMQVLGRRGYV